MHFGWDIDLGGGMVALVFTRTFVYLACYRETTLSRAEVRCSLNTSKPESVFPPPTLGYFSEYE